MRQSAHSLRLAVSLLLGAMFAALPVVSTAQAATSSELLTESPLVQDIKRAEQCHSFLPQAYPHILSMLTPARFERVDTLPNAVVITQPNTETVYALAPAKTVLQKVESSDIMVEEVVPITPATSIASVSATEPVVSTTQVSSSAPSGSVLSADVLFNLVNAYRTQVGLPPFLKDSWICEVAQSRAPELDGEIWVTHTMHAGFKARNLPYWATENVISMQTEQEALNWWLNSPVHRAAILGNYTFACVACGGKSCAMIFSNLEPKSTVVQTAPTTTPIVQ